MSPRIDLLEKITPNTECWRIKVRIIRMWSLPAFNNKDVINNIEMMSTIHATVRKSLVYKFKSLLKEGEVYVMAYFGVGANVGFFRTSRHEFRLNFQLRTTVKPCDSDVIPRFGCKFVSFDEIFQSPPDFPYLVDVLGLLTTVSSEREYVKDGRNTRMIVMELDVDSVKLEVALFGDYVEELNSLISTGETNQTVVVIQFAKVKTFKGKIVLQNVMFGIRLLFNPEIPEVFEFKKRLPISLGDASPKLNVISDTQTYSLDEDFLSKTPRKTIEDIKDCKDPGLYVVFATMNGISNGPDWWYTTCKCNKPVHPDSGMYYCDRCYCHVVNVIPRYRIKVRVVDVSDSATFVLWDRDATSVLKKTCSQLLESIKIRGGNTDHPSEFDDLLIGKEMLFKVEVKAMLSSEFEPSYKVVRICTDDSILSKFKELPGLVHSNEPDMTNGVSFGDTSLSMDFQDVNSDCCKIYSEPEIVLSSQADNSEPVMTPTKSPCDLNMCLVEGDMSTNKHKEIKKEPED